MGVCGRYTNLSVSKRRVENADKGSHNPGTFVKEGEITKEEARNHPMSYGILKCLGGKDAKPDTGKLELLEGDLLFACSDGLHGQIPEEEIQAVLKTENDPDRMVEELIGKALDAGGEDNITIAGVFL